MRRPNRNIEAFDISLMAVVTKAMGAFLVLMLLLYQSRIREPKMERRAEEAETESRQFEESVATLVRRKEELQRAGSASSEAERLRAQISDLERENRQLNARSQSINRASSLILFFNNTSCGSNETDLYVHGEGQRLPDGTEWEPVRKGPQRLPSVVVAFKNYIKGERAKIYTNPLVALNPYRWEVSTDLQSMILASLGYRLTTDSDQREWQLLFAFGPLIWTRTEELTVWAINPVKPDVGYAIYAKAEGLSRPCTGTFNALLMHNGSQVFRTFPLKKNGQILLVARLVWAHEMLGATSSTPDEQARLDREFGLR
jgi:hypothetical protein